MTGADDNRFGRPGVEFYGQHTIDSGENAVTKIVALPNEVSAIFFYYRCINLFCILYIAYDLQPCEWNALLYNIY